MQHAARQLPVIPAYAAQMAAQRQAPRVVKLEMILTEGCNLRCTYCFEVGKNFGYEMHPDVARRAIDFLIEASRDSEKVHVSFFGGEPMLKFDLIKELVEYARERAGLAGKRAIFQMTTNGTLINEDHCRFFREVNLRYLLSIDGADKDNDLHRLTVGGKGSFALLRERIPVMKRYQHWLGTKMTVTPETAPRVRHNVETLHGLGINQFSISFATGIDWPDEAIADYGRSLEEVFEFYLEEIAFKGSRRLRIGLFELGEPTQAYAPGKRANWGCGAGSGRLAVSARGTYFGCSKLATVNGFDKGVLPLGSVGAGLDRYQNRLMLLDRSDDVRIKCDGCELFDVCQGGCHAANFKDTGNIYVPGDSHCKLMFAQKAACDYARTRISELGLGNSLRWAQSPEVEQGWS